MSQHTLKSGSTILLVFDWELDIEIVESAIFTLVGAEKLQLRYPEVINYKDGYFLIPLTQEQTLLLAPEEEGARISCEAQVNFLNKSVAKSECVSFYFSPSLATEIVDGNTPSLYDLSKVHLKLVDGVLIASVDVDGLEEQIKTVVSGDLAVYDVTVNERLDTKVTSIPGKSLMDDSEIERLSTVDNYDDTDLKNELATKADTKSLEAHTTNENMHVTSSQKAAWDAKVSPDVLSSYSLVENTGYELGLSIDSKTYVMTIELKNPSGTVLSTKTIDFPIESMVVSASYETGTLYLLLQSGQTLSVDISAIVSGLVNDSFTIAGIDMKDNITSSELKAALGLTKADVGLGNVDNTSDANKPVSTATQTALNSKVDKVDGKSLVLDSEIERLASVHNYDDTEIKEEIDKKADKSEVDLIGTSTTSPILDSANGNIRDFSAFGKCEQKSLSGKNLLKVLKFATPSAEYSKVKIDFVYDENDSLLYFEADGTSDGLIYITLASNIMLSGEYILTGCGQGGALNKWSLRAKKDGQWGTYDIGSGVRFTVSEKINELSLQIESGVTLNKVRFYPMIRLASVTDASYEPYCGGIPSPNPSYPQELKAWNGRIKTHGKNLLNNQNMVKGGSYQNNGITYTSYVDKPNMVNVKGTATANSYNVAGGNIESLASTTLKAGTYTQSTTSKNVNVYSMVKQNGTWNIITDKTFTLTEECLFAFRIQIPNGKTVDEDVYCMVEEGTVATSYAPFHESTADLGISLYGIKVASGGNYTDADGQMWLCDKIDMGKGVVERYCGVKVFNGTEYWAEGSSRFRGDIPDMELFPSRTKGFTNLYSFAASGTPSNGYFFIDSGGTPRIYVYDGRYTSVDDFKAFLSENNLTAIYKLATPTTEPLTDAQIIALRNLQTYEDGTYVEYGGLEPFYEIGYWLDTKNGNVVREIDEKVPFSFGVEDGVYGYYTGKRGADTFHPFKSGGGIGAYVIVTDCDANKNITMRSGSTTYNATTNSDGQAVIVVDKVGNYDVIAEDYNTKEIAVEDLSATYTVNMGGVPSQYRVVNYIQSDGQQIIDTGVHAKGTTELDFRFEVMDSNSVCYFGGDDAWLRNDFSVYKNNYFVYGSHSRGGGYEVGKVYNVSLHDYSLLVLHGSTIKDQLVYNPQTFEAKTKLYVFASSRGSMLDGMSAIRVYSLKLYDGKTPLRDFVPVQNKETLECGLYDLVERKFYGNIGSGSFTCG